LRSFRPLPLSYATKVGAIDAERFGSFEKVLRSNLEKFVVALTSDWS
jgi:hypothetical protein